jgi:stearoyl-CoA desaturase (delta-9 desaturase)
MTFNFSLSNYDKIKLAQAIAVVSTIATLTVAFDPILLVFGLLTSWIFYCFGLAICLHKYSSHRSFETKNQPLKYIILWFGTVVTMGSTINFAAGHRQHHRFADTPEDPYYLQGSLWHKIKLFFYWFPTYKISPLIIKDLLRDKDHVKFNDNYWKILLVYPAILLAVDPVLFGYFYALPVTYVLLGMGYVTVLAHLPRLHRFGSVDHTTNDNSWNSRLFSLLLAGEGLHNTHHAHPGLYNYETNSKDIDPAGRIISLIKQRTVDSSLD